MQLWREPCSHILCTVCLQHPQAAVAVNHTRHIQPLQVTYEERRVEAAVKTAAEGAGAQLRSFWGATLAHLEDLPFKLSELPQSFGTHGWRWVAAVLVT